MQAVIAECNRHDVLVKKVCPLPFLSRLSLASWRGTLCRPRRLGPTSVGRQAESSFRKKNRTPLAQTKNLSRDGVSGVGGNICKLNCSICLKFSGCRDNSLISSIVMYAGNWEQIHSYSEGIVGLYHSRYFVQPIRKTLRHINYSLPDEYQGNTWLPGGQLVLSICTKFSGVFYQPFWQSLVSSRWSMSM